MTGAGPVASDADRAALAEVLARPEFQADRWRGEALRRWLAAAWERLTELLGTAEAERWADLGRTVFLVAAAVALLLLWRAARKRRRARAPVASRAREDAESRPAPAVVDLADAERALAAGDAVATVRLAFMASIALLQRRLQASGAEALTGRELAARVADDGFGRLAWLHERTVFGLRPVTSEEAGAALAVATRLAAGPAAAGPSGAGGSS